MVWGCFVVVLSSLKSSYSAVAYENTLLISNPELQSSFFTISQMIVDTTHYGATSLGYGLCTLRYRASRMSPFLAIDDRSLKLIDTFFVTIRLLVSTPLPHKPPSTVILLLSVVRMPCSPSDDSMPVPMLAFGWEHASVMLAPRSYRTYIMLATCGIRRAHASWLTGNQRLRRNL